MVSIVGFTFLPRVRASCRVNVDLLRSLSSTSNLKSVTLWPFSGTSRGPIGKPEKLLTKQEITICGPSTPYPAGPAASALFSIVLVILFPDSASLFVVLTILIESRLIPLLFSPTSLTQPLNTNPSPVGSKVSLSELS